jgi:signal transduction histidine kinase
MARLYLRIYLTVIASLILFALLAAISFRLVGESDRPGGSGEMIAAVVEKLAPPADAPEVEQKRQLDEWRQKSGFDIAIFNRDGQSLVDASDGTLTAPRDEWRSRGLGYWRSHQWARVVQLADGRIVVAARPRHERGLAYRFRWLFLLSLSALAIGVAAYPLVRRLTRRLEALQTGVVALGSGDLSARVPVEGKDEVARLAETFNRSADKIQELVLANRSLLANASHELRSPLARLRMGIEALPKSSAAQVQELGRNIRELDQLIEEILLASRLDNGAAETGAFEMIDFIGLVAEECAWVDCELLIQTEALPMLRGDAKLLRRMLRNLIDNAVRYGGKEITVIIDQPTITHVTLDVCDRGPGVPEQERKRIFEPFYRAVGAGEKHGGVGLGLALVRQIAERHGGSVECLSREGGGSVFRVVLPVHTSDDPKG